MTHQEIREKFLKFFEAREHKIVPSSSLLPTDPSVLFTTAGMQQFKPYYTGEADPMKDFGSVNTVSIQKSMRTSDIDEVGDESHLTFFEMLGNFSFGGYGKKEAINYAYEFITKELGLEVSYVTVFKGDRKTPQDVNSIIFWKEINSNLKIRKCGRLDNFWGPTGTEGPCGPTTEIYIKSSTGKDIEVWNLVFNEYYGEEEYNWWTGLKDNIFNWLRLTEGRGHGNLKLTKLNTLGIDTGMGLERLAMVIQKKNNIFETDLFTPLMEAMPGEDPKIKRIIADHLRASVHLIADGVEPSNKDQGYVLRRLLRRAVFHAINIASAEAMIPLDSKVPKGLDERTFSIIHAITKKAIETSFFEIAPKKDIIFSVIDREMGKFWDLLKSNSELHKVIKYWQTLNKKRISGGDVFKLFSTFGLPVDYIRDEARRSGLEIDADAFEAARKKHQEMSRAGAEKKFGGHGLLLDTGELKAGDEEELKKITRLHTATHLLNQALHNILGDDIKQAGSDITTERARFDFTFPRKLTPEEIKRIEEEVNQKIQEDLPVQVAEVPKEQATEGGARSFRPEKYPDIVKVYYIGTDKDWRKAYSKEFCGGPHVSHTAEIGRFKITKEEAISAGTRRIRATVS